YFVQLRIAKVNTKAPTTFFSTSFDGKSTALEFLPIAPGQYQAEFLPPASGDYQFEFNTSSNKWRRQEY
ncbi:MAG: hypothetical protein MZV64_62975, partial [Ignavibacteriales bacterium]|nr:hypothetical protein [Ignavibacteriales bacterium]